MPPFPLALQACRHGSAAVGPAMAGGQCGSYVLRTGGPRDRVGWTAFAGVNGCRHRSAGSPGPPIWACRSGRRSWRSPRGWTAGWPGMREWRRRSAWIALLRALSARAGCRGRAGAWGEGGAAAIMAEQAIVGVAGLRGRVGSFKQGGEKLQLEVPDQVMLELEVRSRTAGRSWRWSLLSGSGPGCPPGLAADDPRRQHERRSLPVSGGAAATGQIPVQIPVM